MDDPIPERLATDSLFANGSSRIHVNHPLHQGDTPLHDHDFVEIAVVAQGRALHRQLSGTSPAGPGDVVVLQPGHWHAWERCRDLKLYNICFTSGLLQRELAWLPDDPVLARLWGQAIVHLRLTRDSQSRSLALAESLRQRNGRSPGGPDHALAIADLIALLAEIAREAPASHTSHQQDSIIASTMQLMLSNPAYDWSLAELAESAGLERSYLGRRFRKVVGLSPLAWLGRRRCERAAVRLLTSHDAIADIGAAVGWADANYFARRFRQEMGQSPSAYRQQLPLPAAAASHADWIQW